MNMHCNDIFYDKYITSTMICESMIKIFLIEIFSSILKIPKSYTAKHYLGFICYYLELFQTTCFYSHIFLPLFFHITIFSSFYLFTKLSLHEYFFFILYNSYSFLVMRSDLAFLHSHHHFLL